MKKTLDETVVVAIKGRRYLLLLCLSCHYLKSHNKSVHRLWSPITEPPDRLQNLVSSNVESRSAVISWSIGYSGNSAITFFQVDFKASDKPWSGNNNVDASPSSAGGTQTISGNTNSITLRKLKPLSTYHVRVRAENSLGWSDFSDILAFTTEEEGKTFKTSLRSCWKTLRHFPETFCSRFFVQL